MADYNVLARARTARGELVLRERAGSDARGAAALELRVNGLHVMDTEHTHSERALAAAALERCVHPTAVLVGGLGLGYTAREVLEDARVEAVTVAEIEEPLVRWMREGTVPHGPAYLDDSRLMVVVDDVRETIDRSPPGRYDLVLLDVDNGPGWLVHQDNAALYEADLLGRARRCLRPGGTFAVWSAAVAAELLAGLRAVFGSAEQVAVPVTLQGRRETYWLYLAHRR